MLKKLRFGNCTTVIKTRGHQTFFAGGRITVRLATLGLCELRTDIQFLEFPFIQIERNKEQSQRWYTKTAMEIDI